VEGKAECKVNIGVASDLRKLSPANRPGKESANLPCIAESANIVRLAK
jgi:hypothetical protein